jgi:hypothetical protein
MNNDLITDILAYIITALLSYCVGRLQTYHTKCNDEKKAEQVIRDGLQALLRDRMLQSYHYYKEEKKYANADDKANFTRLHNAYKALGKNGVMDLIFKEFMELPTTDPRLV